MASTLGRGLTWAHFCLPPVPRAVWRSIRLASSPNTTRSIGRRRKDCPGARLPASRRRPMGICWSEPQTASSRSMRSVSSLRSGAGAQPGPPQGTRVEPDHEGGVWISSRAELVHWPQGVPTERFPGVITAELLEEASRTLWINSYDRIWRMEHGKRRLVEGLAPVVKWKGPFCADGTVSRPAKGCGQTWKSARMCAGRRSGRLGNTG
jgi:hypothetical protein